MPSTLKLGTLLALTPFLLLAAANGCGSVTSIGPDGGEAGTTGSTGHAGSSGSAGSGAAGTTVSTGAAGASAVAGTTGNMTGSAGRNGAAGTTSAAGTNGQAGTSGGAGKGGSAGTMGAAGTSGPGCICNAIYAPVCGVDGKTYGNSCAANCVNVAIAHQGVCTDGGVSDGSTGDAGGGSSCTLDSDCAFRQAAGCCGQCMLKTAPTPPPPQACTAVLCSTIVPNCGCVNHVCVTTATACPGPITAAAANPGADPQIAIPPPICAQ